MNAFLLAVVLTGAQEPALKIIESVEPDAGRTSVQAVIKLPPMSPREWAALLIIKDALADGTQGYTGYDILNYATAAGDPVRISLAPDHMRIGFAMPSSNLSLASDILKELLDKAYLHEDKVKTFAEEIPFRRIGAWEAIHAPWQPDFSAFRRAEVLSVYRRVFQPSRTTIAITGSFAKGAAQKEFEERLSDWKPEDPGRRRIMEGKAKPLPAPGGPPLTNLKATVDRPVGETFLCAYALGFGKGSAAFRVVREQLRLSYRQEAMLIPGENGWQLGLVFAHSGAVDRLKLVEALKADIEAWNEETLARAKGMMAGTFDLKFGALPILLNPNGWLSTSLEDRTYWQAHAAMKGGTPTTLEALRSAAEQTDLEGLRAAGKAWVEKL